HQNRGGDAAMPQLPAHVEPIHPRQHDVEHDEVVRAARSTLEPSFAVCRRVDLIAFAGKPVIQGEPQARLVFDHEHTRANLGTRGSGLWARSSAVGHHADAFFAIVAVSGSGAGATGNSTVTVVPLPGRLSTRTAP